MDRKEYIQVLKDLIKDSKEVSPLEFTRLDYEALESNAQDFLTSCSDEVLFGVLMNLDNLEDLMQDLISKMCNELVHEVSDYYNYLELKEKYGNVENDN